MSGGPGSRRFFRPLGQDLKEADCPCLPAPPGRQAGIGGGGFAMSEGLTSIWLLFTSAVP